MSQRSKKILDLSSKRRALLEAALEEAGVETSPLHRITRRERTGPIPLSFAQQRMWVLDQFMPGNPTYNIPMALRLKGALQVEALRAGLTEIVRRHEPLRTVFTAVKGTPYQVIQPASELALAERDLSKLPAAEREAELGRVVEAESRHAFDLERGPLFRSLLLRLDATEHVLVMNMHHIVSDGWSLGVFIQELAALYGAFVAGKPSPLAEMPVQYADFAMWQREYLQGEELDRQLGYWQEQLSGLPALELPTDRPRPSRLTFRGTHEDTSYPKTLAAKLTALSQQEGTTLFQTLLAAFAVLLGRYSGQDDIVLGMPIANRNRAETTNLIGFFVNTLVLRLDLKGNPTFRELLERVRAMTLGAYAHQDVPFEKIVEALQSDRDLSRAPLFQVLFVLQNASPATFQLPGLTIEPLATETHTSKFDLGLAMEEGPKGLDASIEYSTDLFDRETIQRMLGQMGTLLEGVAANPDEAIVRLPILSAVERDKLLGMWQARRVPRRELCIHEAFEEQVARTPNDVALVFPALSSGASSDQRLTYAELNERANRLAHYLRSRGVGPETVIGIYVERSPEMVIGLLGAFKAGAAYVPLVPTNPPERTAYMLRDTRAKLLLTQERLRDNLPDYDGPIVYLDAGWPEIAKHPAENPCSGATPDNVAVVIYTSGSTGMPKGTALTARGYMNMFPWCTEQMRLNAETRFLSQLTFTFDSALKDMMLPLLCGGQIILGPTRYNDPVTMVSIIEKYGVTSLSSTPTMLYPMVELASVRNYTPLSSLRCIDVGGEPTQLGKLKPWFASPNCHCGFFHVYGSTECSDLSTGDGPLWGEEFTRLEKLSVGTASPNIRIYIVSRQGEMQPIGVPGEVCVSGIGLARGYLNRPDLTAERFVPDPFTLPIPSPSETGGGRMYRTGDVGRWRADGVLELMGRIDHQVKIRGIRVELGEIEAQMGQQPGVRECVVIVREDTPGDKRLAAYFLPHPGQEPTLNELRQGLKRGLPEYMIPSAFVMLDKWPLLSNGKIDRRALPAPDTSRQLDENFVAPRTPLEEVLAAIWGEVLSQERIGVYDNFFALGGHSLLATQVVAQTRDLLQVELPLQNIFEAPTVAGLAETLLGDPGKRARVEQIAQVLVSVSELSDEEMEEKLGQRQN